MKYLALIYADSLVDEQRNMLDVNNRVHMQAKLPFYYKNGEVLEFPIWVNYIQSMISIDEDKLHVHFVKNINETIAFINAQQGLEYIFIYNLTVTNLYTTSILSGINLNVIKVVIGGVKAWVSGVKYFTDIHEVNKLLNLNKSLSYSLVVEATYYRMGRIYLSKGCVNNCKFCLSEPYKECDGDEINMWFNAFKNMRYIYIGDMTFGINFDRCVKYLNLYNKEHEYIIQTTPKIILKNVTQLRTLKNNRVNFTELGFETAHSDTLKKLNKHHTLADISNSIKYLHNVGINVALNVMLNIKGETVEHYSKTIKFLEKHVEYIAYLNITNYSDYSSKDLLDSSELQLIKSWNTTPTSKLNVYKFAEDVYRLNHELLNNF
jgi:hypothetical protein